MKAAKLTIAAIAAIALAACSNQPASDQQSPAINCIMDRTSVREYTNADVTEAQVETLLKAAMAAPTAVNKQPWEFIVIRDKATKQAIADSIASMRMAADAPVVIVTCGDLTRTLEGVAQAFWTQDLSAATENLLLAATAQGLGAVWCGVYPLPDRVAFISSLLNLPDHIVPLAVVPVGHPAATPQPKDKWQPDRIHLEKW